MSKDNKKQKSNLISSDTQEDTKQYSSEAQFEYRCRRCGKIYRNPCCSPELANWILIEITMNGSGGRTTKGGKVYLHTTHQCKDGGMGIADLQGYRIVN